jgi:ElaB/YqjD/DUF883 family membrane-anchored ribosome-binding protein
MTKIIDGIHFHPQYKASQLVTRAGNQENNDFKKDVREGLLNTQKLHLEMTLSSTTLREIIGDLNYFLTLDLSEDQRIEINRQKLEALKVLEEIKGTIGKNYNVIQRYETLVKKLNHPVRRAMVFLHDNPVVSAGIGVSFGVILSSLIDPFISHLVDFALRLRFPR